MKKVLVPRNVPGSDFSPLADEFDVVMPANPFQVFSAAEIEAILPEVSAVVSMEAMDRTRIERAPKLEVIVANGAGYDNVDLVAAGERKIPVVNVPHTVTRATAEFAFGLILAATRRIAELDRLVRTSEQVAPLFDMGRMRGMDLQGKTLGLYGMGRIGRTVAKFATAFDMKVIYHNRRELAPEDAMGAAYVSFGQLLDESDIVSIHAPLNDESRGKFDRDVFTRMKKTAVLVNTGRGAIVDTDALAWALTSGEIRAAALDVFPDEPNIPENLIGLENVILTAHVAVNSDETRAAMAEAIMDVIRRFLRRPVDASGLNIVNRDRLGADWIS